MNVTTEIILPTITGLLVGVACARVIISQASTSRIKRLISTELQGDFVTVCFEFRTFLGRPKLRNFKVMWLKNLCEPNEVIDMETWEAVHGSLAKAAQHAATVHMRSTGKVQKTIHPGEEWRF